MECIAGLKKNQVLKLTDGQTVTVTGKLGEGGQGIVYRVRINGTKEERALKWYFVRKIKDPEGFRRNLEANIKRGSPSGSFVWPEKLTEWEGGSFGYTMKIIPDRYKGFSKYLRAKTQFSSCSAMVDAAINIVVAFKKLIGGGYSFQDVNDGSFLIDPNNGDVLICDCDNVVPYGSNAGIEGKARYKAPEIVRGETFPNKQTDRFSLAVILFLLLVGNHPLEGVRTNVPCLTNKYDKKFFGREPIFIFDPKNNTNRPIPELHENAIKLWPYYPEYIREAFERSFSQKSMLECQDRLLEQEWLSLLIQLKSSIIRCPNCGSELFLGAHGVTHCPDCNMKISPAGVFRFNKRRANVEMLVPIYEGCRMFGFHMDEMSEDYKSIAAELVVKPGKYGLKNHSGKKWIITSANRQSAVKKNNETAVIGNGFCIDFGKGVMAEVCTK